MANSLFLITGGSGFLGINLCRYLLARGHKVRSLDIAPFDYPERSALEIIAGDVRHRDTMKRAMAGVEVVVHAAAALPFKPTGGHLFNRCRGHAHRSKGSIQPRSVARNLHVIHFSLRDSETPSTT